MSVPRWLLQIALALLVVRFAVPVYAIAAEGLHRHVLADQYQAAQAQLERSRDALGAPSAAAPPSASPAEPPPWYERWVPDWAKKAELPRLPDVPSIGQRVEQSIERLIDLAVLFCSKRSRCRSRSSGSCAGPSGPRSSLGPARQRRADGSRRKSFSGLGADDSVQTNVALGHDEAH